MNRFHQQNLPTDDRLYLEDTDKPLPETLNPQTRYMYFKTIAKGGKAIIQSCRDTHLGGVVCYKQLKPEFRSNEVELTRFVREARISAQLQHPGTIPTYELGRDRKGDMYFTMKLVHGYTLREILDYRERYDLGQLLGIIIQVGQALAYAHDQGVIHRDIKPENVLVGPYGEVLLMDWGLAKVWHRDSTPGAAEGADAQGEPDGPVTNITGDAKLEGTITYMSPEQLERDPAIDRRSDIFTLGVVLYELLAGRTPEVAETVYEMKDQILTGAPSPPSNWVKWPIPAILDDITMACLSKAPSSRPANCLDVVRVLQEAG